MSTQTKKMFYKITVSVIVLGLLITGGWFVLQNKTDTLITKPEPSPLATIKTNFEELIFTEDAKNHQVVDKTLAFVPLYQPGEVVIIDIAEKKIIKKIKVGEELHNSVVVKLHSKN